MILCIMQFPPSPDSHGGSQRAWFLLQALAKSAPVHFVLIYAAGETHATQANLKRLKMLAASITSIPVHEWNAVPSLFSRAPRWVRKWITLIRLGSVDAPRFSRTTIEEIARELPTHSPDVVFAGRLPAATIVDKLIAIGKLQPHKRVIDFDDILSTFRLRAAAVQRRDTPLGLALRDRIETRLIREAEDKVLRHWDAVSVCSAEDVQALKDREPKASVHLVPNVTDRKLAARPTADNFNLLFVGNLSFAPNLHGLNRFLDEAWPRIIAQEPDTRMTVVGLYPGLTLRRRLEALDIALRDNVPSVEPYYAKASAVVIPIFFGGGTRVKAIEAMAFGRPIISTSVGVEGLTIQDDVHAAIAETPVDLADKIVALIRSPESRERLAYNAKRLQEEKYAPLAMDTSVLEMLRGPLNTAT